MHLIIIITPLVANIHKSNTRTQYNIMLNSTENVVDSENALTVFENLKRIFFIQYLNNIYSRNRYYYTHNIEFLIKIYCLVCFNEFIYRIRHCFS